MQGFVLKTWFAFSTLEPGLFRVPGNKDAIDAIKTAYNNGKEVVLDDVHDAGGVLKQFLREVSILLLLCFAVVSCQIWFR